MSEDSGRIQKRVDGIDWERNRAWKYLSAVCDSHLKHEELVSIADLAAKRLGTRLGRDAGRLDIVKVKWLEENCGVIEEKLPRLHSASLIV
jgi:hypothetical protein